MKQEKNKKIYKLLLDSALIDFTSNEDVQSFIEELRFFTKEELLSIYVSNSLIDKILSHKPVSLLPQNEPLEIEDLLDEHSNERKNFQQLFMSDNDSSSKGYKVDYFMNIFGVLERRKRDLIVYSEQHQKGINKCLKSLNYLPEKDKIITLKNRYNNYGFDSEGARYLWDNVTLEQLHPRVKNDWLLFRLGNGYSVNPSDLDKMKQDLDIQYFNLEHALRLANSILYNNHTFQASVEKLGLFKDYFKTVFNKENSIVKFCQLFLKNNNPLVDVKQPALLKPKKVLVSRYVDNNQICVDISYIKEFIDILGVNLTQQEYPKLKQLLFEKFNCYQTLALMKEGLMHFSWNELIEQNHFNIIKKSHEFENFLLTLDKKEALFSYAQKHDINKKILFASLLQCDLKDEVLVKIIKNNKNYLISEDFNITIKDKEHVGYYLLKKDCFASFDELMRIGYNFTLLNRDGKNLIAQLEGKKKYQPFVIILEQFKLENIIEQPIDCIGKKKTLKL